MSERTWAEDLKDWAYSWNVLSTDGFHFWLEKWQIKIEAWEEAQRKLDRIIGLQQRYCQGCSESCEYCRNMVLRGLKRILDSEKTKEEASP